MTNNTPKIDLERLKAAAVPKGWKLVPIELTVGMLEEVLHCMGLSLNNVPLVHVNKVSAAYAAMLAAAPQPPTSSDGADLTRSEDVLNNQGKVNITGVDSD